MRRVGRLTNLGLGLHGAVSFYFQVGRFKGGRVGYYSLQEMIEDVLDVMECHGLDEMRFSPRTVRLLNQLAKDPKWNRDLVNPHALPPLPHEGEGDRRQQ